MRHVLFPPDNRTIHSATFSSVAKPDQASRHIHSSKTWLTDPNNAATQNPTLPDPAVTALKLPQFWQSDFELWFLSVEPLFRQHRVVSQTAKYDLVIGALPAGAIAIVRDILRSPPADNSYDHLKTELAYAAQPSQNNVGCSSCSPWRNWVTAKPRISYVA